MGEDETSVLLILTVAIIALVGVGLAVASFTAHESLGGMMSGGGGMGSGGGGSSTTTSPPGTAEWGLLIASVAFFLGAVVALLRSPAHARSVQRPEPWAASAPPVSAGSARPAVSSPGAPVAPAQGSQEPAAAPVAEPTLMRLLNADERRMYLEIRDHGGLMLQRDLVALGVFSKAKVTRVLDKLEAKGIVVREAHGMTNRVRIVSQPAK